MNETSRTNAKKSKKIVTVIGLYLNAEGCVRLIKA